jgi:predicted nucleic acid-binding protein
VYGGYFEDEFERPTKELFRRVRSGWFEIVYSDMVESEIEDAPDTVKRLYDSWKRQGLRVLVTPNVALLAKKYMDAKVFPKKSFNDAVHIALVSVYAIPYLVSWDSNHIVNFRRILKVNEINLSNGYGLVNIVTPQQLI